jgi:phenylacetate-CoA ligase
MGLNSLIRRQAVRMYDLATQRQFLKRMDELNRTQWLPREKLLEIQREKLHRLLTYTCAHVPYYRRLFDSVGFKPDEVLHDLDGMRKIPLLNKPLVRKHFDEIQTTEAARRESLSKLTTGGSTGQPLVFLQDSNFRDHVTADLHRHLTWGGWQFGDVHAYIWGANFEVKSSQALRTRLMDKVLNRFVTNAYVLSEESMNAFAAEVRRRRPRTIFCYPSALYRFAEFARDQGYDDLRFEAMYSSAEVLYPGQREFIEQTFGGKMFNRYATRELACIGCECSAHSGLHVSVENIYLEVLKDGEPAAPGESGDVIVTNLNNYGMPFIRYSVGDIGAWCNGATQCSCGRALPMIELVQGRRVDMFKTRDGRAVWGGFASPLFGMKGVEQFQLVQKSLDHVVARIVKDGDLDQSGLDTIKRTVKIALGDHVQVDFEFPEKIGLNDSGKYRYAISEISES